MLKANTFFEALCYYISLSTYFITVKYTELYALHLKPYAQNLSQFGMFSQIRTSENNPEDAFKNGIRKLSLSPPLIL
jgi:hypothetical protein